MISISESVPILLTRERESYRTREEYNRDSKDFFFFSISCGFYKQRLEFSCTVKTDNFTSFVAF